MSLSTIYSLTRPTSKLLEIYFWVGIAGIFSGRFWLEIYSYQEFHPEMLKHFYFDVLVGIGVVLFPVLFNLIFGSLPLEALREKIRDRKSVIISSTDGGIEKTTEKKTGINILENKSTSVEIVRKSKSKLNAEELLGTLAIESENLSQKIYNRSGAYLLVGVLIAFLGLAFFYTQTVELKNVTDIYTVLILTLPRFGILFFIEFIAFFFLKQYRSSMEEFRYYEEVKRSREDNLAVIRLSEKDWKQMDFYKVLEHCKFKDQIGKLSKDETTTIIENQKLQTDEYEILLRLAEILKPLKTTKNITSGST